MNIGTSTRKTRDRQKKGELRVQETRWKDSKAYQVVEDVKEECCKVFMELLETRRFFQNDQDNDHD